MRVITEHGYVLIHVGRDHHLADSRGYAYEHRVVMEQKLGRLLQKGEVVHHVDHDTQNNEEDNLELMPSRWHYNAKHRRLPTLRQAPGQENEQILCACGCGETIWRFNKNHIEVRFVSGHNGKLNKKIRPPKPKQGEHNRRKKHCLFGHAFTPENTRVNRGRRICRTCHRLREARRRENRLGV